MLIRGTKKIRGILDLYSIKQQLKPGQSLIIPESDYWQSDVQMAVRMGLVQSDLPKEKKDPAKKPDKDKMIKFKNVHHRSIGFEGHKEEIASGQEFFLSEVEIETNPIRNAIAKGMIKVIGSTKEVAEDDEVTVNVFKKMKPEEKDISIDVNEELPMPTVVKDNKGVVWNISSDTVKGVELVSHVIESDTPNAVDSNTGDPKRSSIVMDPNKAHNKKDDTIVFVDKEEDIRHAASHPKLKPKNIEVDKEPVDEVEEKDRISKHPVLSKKPKTTNEDIFIDDLDDIQARIKRHPILKKKAEEEAKKAAKKEEPLEEDTVEEDSDS